jgi:hypothetical protein
MKRPSARLRKVLAGAGLALTLALSASACSGSGSSNGNSIINAQQGVQDTQYAFVQPLPYFPFSRIRQNLTEVEAINALGIASTTFMFIPGVPNPVLICPSVGVPVPVTDNLSNPWVPVWSNGGTNGNAGVAVGQEEPMGVFTGDSTGTDSLCINGTGGQYEGYNEAYDVSVTTSAYWDPNKWGPGKGYIIVTGAPVMPVCKVHHYQGTDSSGNPQTNYEEVCTDPTKPAPKTIPVPSSSPAPAQASQTPAA